MADAQKERGRVYRYQPFRGLKSVELSTSKVRKERQIKSLAEIPRVKKRPRTATTISSKELTLVKQKPRGEDQKTKAVGTIVLNEGSRDAEEINPCKKQKPGSGNEKTKVEERSKTIYDPDMVFYDWRDGVGCSNNVTERSSISVYKHADFDISRFMEYIVPST